MINGGWGSSSIMLRSNCLKCKGCIAMCEQRVLKALKSHTKTLSFNNSDLKSLPAALGRLTFLTSFSAKNNALKTLPEEITLLTSLSYLNLGSNELEDCSLPFLQGLIHLVTLHLFSNNLHAIPQDFCNSLGQLRVLNLNYNHLSSLPCEISCLQSLQQLSVSNNQLHLLPAELGYLTQLQELHLEANHLSRLPHTLGHLKNLKKLLLHKNKLRSLPNNIMDCPRLQQLDVSSNKLELFPSTLVGSKLKEFHYESNPLLPYIPVAAEQHEEVLKLKEITSRLLINQMKNDAMLQWQVERHPELKQLLSNAGTCALCGQPFIHSWLQCVQFIPVKQVLPKLHSIITSEHLPIRAALCSYRCFNSEGHNLYGIAA